MSHPTQTIALEENVGLEGVRAASRVEVGEVGEGVERLCLLEQLAKGEGGQAEHEDVDDHTRCCNHSCVLVVCARTATNM